MWLKARSKGAGDLLKERTIGVEVFGREPSYDTGSDHVVRTAASELRKRLAIYYADEKHKPELRIDLLPGSYVPQFSLPVEEPARTTEHLHAAATLSIPLPSEAAPTPPLEPTVITLSRGCRRSRLLYWMLALAALVMGVFLFKALSPESPLTTFWAPVVRSNIPILIAVGDVPNGPPTMSSDDEGDMPPSPKPGHSDPPSVPFADTVTIAKVTGVLTREGRQVILRRETSSSFSDLRERPVVLIGAFNNEWSLRLTRSLRFSLAMDPIKRVIYIRDRDHPESRQWNWSIERHAENTNRVTSASLHDYALISRITDSETGQVMVIIGGLYIYGTQAAGEFLSDPQLMSMAKSVLSDATHKNLQIVLETTVTQETPGPPHIVAVSSK